MFLILLSQPALAWNLTGWVWAPEQMPIPVTSTTYLEDSLAPTVSEETGRYWQEELLIVSFCNWHWSDYCDEMLSDEFGWDTPETAECADIRFEYQGLSQGNEGVTNDGISKLYWDDPSDNIGAGTWAVTYTRSGNNLIKTVADQAIADVANSDIVMNDDVDWGTDLDIVGGCNSEVSAEGVLTHEVGHLLGMAHSCEQGELCVSEDFLQATMFWATGYCNTNGSTINDDDVGGITALYGPYVYWTTPDETVRSGAAPLEMCFEVLAEQESLDALTEVNWRFGDGETSTEVTPCHTYEQQGQYSITAEFKGVDDTCGEWEVSQTQRAYALVCDVPQPGFELQPSDGLTYQIVNTTVVDTYGCVDGVQWAVYKGGNADGEPIETLSAWSPKIEFPEEGEYTIKLTTQGPGGEADLVMTDTYESQRAEALSCATGGSSSRGLAIAGALLALVGLARRRR